MDTTLILFKYTWLLFLFHSRLRLKENGLEMTMPSQSSGNRRLSSQQRGSLAACKWPEQNLYRIL